MLIRQLMVVAVVLVGISDVAFADIGRVKRTQGEASILRGAETLQAEPGFVLDAKDVLVTGADGRISVTFIDNSRFSAGPDSRVALETFEFNPTTQAGAFTTVVEKGSLAIISGQIAKHDRDAMRVRIPTSILGVRGTRLIIDVPK